MNLEDLTSKQKYKEKHNIVNLYCKVVDHYISQGMNRLDASYSAKNNIKRLYGKDFKA